MKSEETNMEPNELPDELANIRRINTYTAPADYFDGLAEDIMAKVHLPLVTDMPLSAPPSNYFDGLADAVLARVKNASAQSEVQKELEDIEPLLNLVSKRNVYQVPEGYFDSFTMTIPVVKKSAAVVKMNRTKTWFSYAVAAVVAGAIALGVILFANQEGSPIQKNYTQALAKVSDEDLSDYLDNTAQDIDVLPAAQEENGVIDGESLFKLMLNNVSDNELENYLNENDDSDEKNIKGI